MGGEVAFAIRRAGKQETREFSKHAASQVCTADFFSNKGPFHQEWPTMPKVAFAPIDYGLVAVDFDQRWIGSVQDYTHMDTQFFSGLLYRGEGAKAKVELGKLLAAGRLKGLSDIEGVELPDGQDFDAWFKHLMKQARKQQAHALRAQVAPPKGWTIEHHPNSKEGWSAFVKDLARHGWEFSSRDIAQWEEYGRSREFAGLAINALVAQVAFEDIDQTTATVDTPRQRHRL